MPRPIWQVASVRNFRTFTVNLYFQGPNYTGFYCNETNSGMLVNLTLYMSYGPLSAVGSESDCTSRGRELIVAWSHTFVEIDSEIISMVILLPSTESFKKGCCHLQVKVYAQSTG